jgi:hypothetical protein
MTSAGVPCSSYLAVPLPAAEVCTVRVSNSMKTCDLICTR